MINLNGKDLSGLARGAAMFLHLKNAPTTKCAECGSKEIYMHCEGDHGDGDVALCRAHTHEPGDRASAWCKDCWPAASADLRAGRDPHNNAVDPIIKDDSGLRRGDALLSSAADRCVCGHGKDGHLPAPDSVCQECESATEAKPLCLRFRPSVGNASAPACRWCKHSKEDHRHGECDECRDAQTDPGAEPCSRYEPATKKNAGASCAACGAHPANSSVRRVDLKGNKVVLCRDCAAENGVRTDDWHSTKDLKMGPAENAAPGLTPEQERRKADLVSEIQFLRAEIADGGDDEDRADLRRAEAALKALGFTLGNSISPDPDDDCRSCGHPRHCHVSRACSRCDGSSMYRHAFAERGDEPAPLGDIDNDAGHDRATKMSISRHGRSFGQVSEAECPDERSLRAKMVSVGAMTAAEADGAEFHVTDKGVVFVIGGDNSDIVSVRCYGDCCYNSVENAAGDRLVKVQMTEGGWKGLIEEAGGGTNTIMASTRQEVLDRARELGAAVEKRNAAQSTKCDYCSHPLNLHGGGDGGQCDFAGGEDELCDCEYFVDPSKVKKNATPAFDRLSQHVLSSGHDPFKGSGGNFGPPYPSCADCAAYRAYYGKLKANADDEHPVYRVTYDGPHLKDLQVELHVGPMTEEQIGEYFRAHYVQPTTIKRIERLNASDKKLTLEEVAKSEAALAKLRALPQSAETDRQIKVEETVLAGLRRGLSNAAACPACGHAARGTTSVTLGRVCSEAGCRCADESHNGPARRNSGPSAFCSKCDCEKRDHDTSGKCTLCDCLSCYDVKNASDTQERRCATCNHFSKYHGGALGCSGTSMAGDRCGCIVDQALVNASLRKFRLGDTVRMSPEKLARSMWRGEDMAFEVVDVYEPGGQWDYQIQSLEANRGSSQVKEGEIVANSVKNEAGRCPICQSVDPLHAKDCPNRHAVDNSPRGVTFRCAECGFAADDMAQAERHEASTQHSIMPQARQNAGLDKDTGACECGHSVHTHDARGCRVSECTCTSTQDDFIQNASRRNSSNCGWCLRGLCDFDGECHNPKCEKGTKCEELSNQHHNGVLGNAEAGLSRGAGKYGTVKNGTYAECGDCKKAVAAGKSFRAGDKVKVNGLGSNPGTRGVVEIPRGLDDMVYVTESRKDYTTGYHLCCLDKI